jgi:hypothetical protein
MAQITVRFLSANGAVQAEKNIPLRNDAAISYTTLTDALFSAGLEAYAGRLDSGEFKVNGREPRDLTFQGRVEFKSCREEGVGTGTVVEVNLMAQGAGAGQCHIPVGSTIRSAFARANITPAGGSTIMLNGQAATLDTLIPAGASHQVASVGAVKGGC